MTELLLIRHGETEWNAGEIFRGRADIDLNENGILQAKLLAGYLSNRKLEAVYSSPLIRAVRTAGGIITFRKLDIRIEPGLTDLHYGEWQGMAGKQVKEIYRSLYSAWEKTPHQVTMPGGESLDDVKKRSGEVIKRILRHHSGTVAVVSHRVVLKVIICSLLGLDNEHFWNIRMDTCGITTFTCEKGNAILTSHNDISFLDAVTREKLADF